MAIAQSRPFRIIAENATAHLVANVAVYGVLLAGFGIGLAFPQLSQAQHSTGGYTMTGQPVYEAFALRYFVHPLAEWLLSGSSTDC